MKNSIMVIQPYWYAGTWVFDDEATGLDKEPFVAGVPDMIDRMVEDIPNARDGFRLTFSQHAFPGAQTQLKWAREDGSGNWYSSDLTQTEGWLWRSPRRVQQAALHRMDQTVCFTREERRTGWQVAPVMHESPPVDKSRANEETAPGTTSTVNVDELAPNVQKVLVRDVDIARHDPLGYGARGRRIEGRTSQREPLPCQRKFRHRKLRTGRGWVYTDRQERRL